MLVWDFDPTLIKVGPLEIRYYGVLFASAVLFGFQVLRKTFRESNLNEELAETLSTYTVVSLVIGARLVHCLFYNPEFYLSNPLEILFIWKGGIASHGGALGMLVAVWLFNKKTGIGFEKLADKIAVSITAAPVLIRLGNFFNSEIVGKATDVPWSVIFLRYDNIPRHPSQLYEAFLGFLVFIAMWKIYWKTHKEKPDGYFMYLFITLYFTQRFLIEFVKESQTNIEQTLPLDIGQLLSLPFWIFGVLMLWKRSRQAKKIV
ncbi:prolipoprotein diacylglyceryl transferase [bacterium]|nr:prolipoprotein diacylglyceryl transferase [bacterium]